MVPGERETPTPRDLMISKSTSTSEITGTFSSVIWSGVRREAAISLTTAFFAPEIFTSPLRGIPPSIINFFPGTEIKF